MHCHAPKEDCNAMTDSKPLALPPIIGHRGACGYAPENTLESIKTAAEMGCGWVEFDVKLTKDSVPVLFHDETLERTTNGSGNMADISWDDLQNLDAGSWFADSFSGIRVPTLEEAIEVLLAHDLGFNLEIKPCPGREIETAEAALDVLSRIWDDPSKLLISSFQHVSLEVARDMAPEWQRGFLMSDPLPNWEEMAGYLEARTININAKKTSREAVESYIDAGFGVLAYTVNDAAQARKLMSWGVDGVFTDVPDVIQSILTKH